MPIYNYQNTRTGETFARFSSIADMNAPCEEDPDVVMLLSKPNIFCGPASLGAHRKADKFREKILEPKIKALNPRGLKTGDIDDT